MSIPFTPRTPTAALAVGTVAANLILPGTGGGILGGESACLLSNIGTQVVWVSATTTAAIPASGGSTASFPILPNTQLTVTLPGSATLSTIAAATGSTLYATQGTV